MRKRVFLFAAPVLAFTTAGAQEPGTPDVRRTTVEIRGGVNVPTFDIADVAQPGPSIGAGLGLPLSDRWNVLADVDLGFHSGDDLADGSAGPDVNVYHYLGKLSYDLVEGTGSRWSVAVNAGAGAMTFDVDPPEGEGTSDTYFAINVGAKIGYALSDRVELLLSPQGDIAFTDEDELGTSDAWVWPFAAGLRLAL